MLSEESARRYPSPLEIASQCGHVLARLSGHRHWFLAARAANLGG